MTNLPLPALLVLAVCCGGPCLSAQTAPIDLPDPALAKYPRLIVLSGIAVEGSAEVFQTFFLSAERPVGLYQHVGLQYSTYLPGDNSYYATLRSGYEIGLFSKFYLHGRLSGRRSHLYYAPMLRFGSRKMTFNNYFFGTSTPYDFQVNTTKLLICLGGHYNLGHGVFEWSLPFGVEYGRSNLPADADPYGYSGINGRQFVLLPGIALGFRL